MTARDDRIGTPTPRIDGPVKVSGSARYAAEFAPPGLLYAAMVTSTVPAGRIRAIDTTSAEAAAGVVVVLTHLNAERLPFAEADPRPSVYPVSGRRLPVLQSTAILYSGQPVAVVVAHTQDHAEAAAALVEVGYDRDASALTVFDPGRATPPSRAASDKGRGPVYEDGDADEAVRTALVSVDHVYTQSREFHCAMEPHATVAYWQGDRLTLWEKSQWVQNVADEVALTFGVNSRDITVINPFVGGAFGSALRPWPHTTLAVMAARRVRRPVRLEVTRRQLSSAIGYRPQARQRVALGAHRDGRLAGIVAELTSETSVFEEFADPSLSPAKTTYASATRRTRYDLVRTNINTPCPMRGPGWATGLVGQEIAMDELAVALGVDPIELRLRNFAETDPGTGRPWAGNELRACYREGAAAFGWPGRVLAPRGSRAGDLLIGTGMATAVYTAARYPTSASASFDTEGSVTVRCATTDMGPGTYTSMAQVAADVLGVPLTRVRIELGDTRYPAAMEHGGSTTMASVGSAVLEACRELRARLHKIADEVQIAPNDVAEVLTCAGLSDLSVEVRSSPGDEQQTHSHHAFGAVFVEVAVDADLGTVAVNRIVGAYDGGRIVNPRLARQQVLGGMVQGIGMALTEKVEWDARYGRVMSANLADYHVPVNANVADLDAIFVPAENPVGNPLGVKGVAELGICGVAPAIANAIWHATGRRVRDLPVLPDALL